MKRPDTKRIRREIEVLSDPSWRVVDHCSALLDWIDRIESELAGYRSRDDSGFKRALEAQKHG